MKRRQFLTLFGTSLATGALTRPAFAQSAFQQLPLRGAINATSYGVVPDAARDQSFTFQKMLDSAAERGEPLFLPAGNYVVSEVSIPEGTVLAGVPGRTILVLGAGTSILRATGKNAVHLSNLVLDGGAGRRPVDALLVAKNIEGLSVQDCIFRRSPADHIRLEACGGKLTGNRFSGAQRFGLFSIDGRDLDIDGNIVSDCADGGIIVHRSRAGHDGTRISGNRVFRIGARSGGTGQWGNGVNVYRADNVAITDNMVDDCAFSAIRANTARNIQVTGNRCAQSGETAIYAEFSFESAIIANNLVTGAASGISVTNFNEGGRGATVTGNIIRDLTGAGPYPAMAPGFGIGIAVEADTIVSGNLVDGAPLFGINAGWGPHLRDVVLQANVIRNAHIGIGVSDANGVGQVVIADNLIAARHGAIRAHRWTEVGGEDLLDLPASVPPHITLSGNQVS